MTDRDALAVLACEIDRRPRGAPDIEAVADSIVDVRRDGERALAVSFRPEAFSDVEAFVAAERRCCPALSWTLDRSDGAVRLIITAQPRQIDVLERLFTRPQGERPRTAPVGTGP
jgi:hypothetical protein